MDTLLMESAATPDDALWQASTRGDREAFAEIVTRYQSLICSLAYTRTGNLASSQDLAQETFVTAWRQLADLREPAKLRSWLCGIVRNLAANAVRAQQRRGGPTEDLDAIAEPVATGDDPEAQAVSREEEALLWRALAGMPESFREPLVLFYREERSIAQVAAQLDLSEDAVKQRLSRGRALLREEMATVVESALTRSRPNAAFTAAVIGAIALTSPAPAAAAIGAAASGGAAAAGQGAVGTVGAAAIAGPAAGLTTAWLASKAVGLNARSEAERALIARSFRQAMLFTFPAVALLLALIYFGRTTLQTSPWFLVIATGIWTVGLLAFLISLGMRGQRAIERIRIETGTTDADYARELAPHGLRLPAGSRFVSRRTLFGLPLFAYGSVGMDIGAAPSRAVRAWIAVGDLAVSPFMALGGVAVAPIAIGGVTVGAISLSLGGIGVGLLAAGSLAAGWWAFGAVAVAWKAAAGGAAIAHDYAIGGVVRAAEANSAAASAWFAAQWFSAPIQLFFLALPIVVLLAIVVPLAILFRRAWQFRALVRSRRAIEGPDATVGQGAVRETEEDAATPRTTDRLHGLDALRAAALLSGIVLHAAVSFVLPAGLWAVGQPRPQLTLGWLVYYLHTFRLEIFFLLAGFFGALVVGRRGVAAYARDRALRILLVFAVALYPMKFALAGLWITGGRLTGWLELPPLVDGLPWYALALGSLAEPWPNIALTHLWFLYVLSCIAAVFLIGRAVAVRMAPQLPALSTLSRGLRAVVSNRAWPLVLAIVLTPVLALMRGVDVDTPDRSFVWHLPVMAVYGAFFSFGWWLEGQRDLLAIFAARRWSLLIGGVAISFVSAIGVGVRLEAGDWATANATALRWATSFGTSLTMAASVFGWLGAFATWFARPSARLRYLADASYFIYIAHLPVVVGLQVALARSGVPWWVQVPFISVLTVLILVPIYHWTVRYTWLGRWLNGPRQRPTEHANVSLQ